MVRALAIVNPRSANGATAKRWPAVADLLASAGLPCEARFTGAPGEATAIAREALAEGVRVVLAIGGDGTINEVANGFFSPDGSPVAPEAALGVIPAGTGSDFIKTMRIPRHEAMAVAAAAGGRSRRVDVGHASFDDATGGRGRRVFLNIAEVGLGGAVVDRVNHTSKALGGFASFLIGTLATFATYRNPRLKVSFDDGAASFDGPAAGVVVGNGKYFGGGMAILPDAEPDDGLLDTLIMGDLSRAELYANVWGVYRGTHLRHPKLALRRAIQVTVQAPEPALVELDGELVGRTPVTFRVLPRALNVLS